MTHFPLEPDEEQMRAMTGSALDRVVDLISSLDEAPAAYEQLDTGLLETIREELPRGPSGFDSLLETITRGAAQAFNTTGPGYLAFIPGGGLFAAALAEFLANATNRFVNVWSAAPAFAQMEATVGRWFCDLFGYPSEALGILTTGGSMANLSAVITARRALLPEDFLPGTMYVSDQVHASVTKAALLAGFPQRSVRVVPTTEKLAMDAGALETMIAADRAGGSLPFLVVGSAGTTNTGAIDPLRDIAAIARRHGLWFHVDGAYGGFFQLTERGRAWFDGIEASDSVTLDPHKGMFLPYGTGCLLVRDASKMRDAHHVGAHYLQDLAPGEAIPNFSEYSIELSRDFRGLRVWLPIKLHGMDAFRSALDEKLDLAGVLYEGLASHDTIELPWGPGLTVVPFRLAGADDESNRRFLERVNASGRIFLSSTMVRDRFTLRACVLCHRTHRDRIDEAIEIITRAAREEAAS